MDKLPGNGVLLAERDVAKLHGKLLRTRAPVRRHLSFRHAEVGIYQAELGLCYGI